MHRACAATLKANILVSSGSDGANFFFRDDENRILVGNVKDLKRPAESGEKIQLLPSHLQDFSAANRIGFVHPGAVVRSHELTTLPLSR